MLNDSIQNFEGSKQKSPTNHEDGNILQSLGIRSCISGFNLAAAILRGVTKVSVFAVATLHRIPSCILVFTPTASYIAYLSLSTGFYRTQH